MILKMIVYAAAGGACGYGWYRLVGCPDGACPFTRNPYISVLWGACAGILLSVW